MRNGHRSPPKVGTYLCPNCGVSSRTDVVDSRPGADGYTHRRRYCNGCKSKFTTVELPASTLPALDLTALGAKLAADLNASITSFNILRRALKDAARRVE